MDKAFRAILLQSVAYALASGPQDRDLTFAQICKENGFLYEEHEVVTEDGYILTVLRIPGLANEQENSKVKAPVFMQHGLTASADSFIIHYADKAPAFVAATAGYDVWLGNSRGNSYSLKHQSLDSKKNAAKYWDFDWVDMGTKDLPAVLDMITETTGFEKVAYIGHSQGTTQMFAALTRMNDYMASKISLFVGMGPVAKLPNQSIGLLSFADEHYDQLYDASRLFQVHSVGGPQNGFQRAQTEAFCKVVPQYCFESADGWINGDPKTDDMDRWDITTGKPHSGNQSPIKSLLHYAQNMRQSRFQEYAPDFHHQLHIHEHKNTALFDLSLVKDVPIALFAGKYDLLADPVDARWIRDQLGDNMVKYKEIEGGHSTFMVGKDMSFFSEDIMRLLHRFQPLHGHHAFLQ